MKTFIITNTILLLWMLPGMTWAQFITITGYINDSSNGKALENVSIFEANSGIGTITNQNGFYRLVLHNKKADLKISYTGFKDCSQIFEMQADTTLMVKLEPRILDRKIQKKEVQLQADNSLAKQQNEENKK